MKYDRTLYRSSSKEASSGDMSVLLRQYNRLFGGTRRSIICAANLNKTRRMLAHTIPRRPRPDPRRSLRASRCDLGYRFGDAFRFPQGLPCVGLARSHAYSNNRSTCSITTAGSSIPSGTPTASKSSQPHRHDSRYAARSSAGCAPAVQER